MISESRLGAGAGEEQEAGAEGEVGWVPLTLLSPMFPDTTTTPPSFEV